MREFKIPPTETDEYGDTVRQELFYAIACKHGDLAIISECESDHGWTTKVVSSPYGNELERVALNLLTQPTEVFRFDGTYKGFLVELFKIKGVIDSSVRIRDYTGQALTAFGIYYLGAHEDDETYNSLRETERTIIRNVLNKERASEFLKTFDSSNRH